MLESFSDDEEGSAGRGGQSQNSVAAGDGGEITGKTQKEETGAVVPGSVEDDRKSDTSSSAELQKLRQRREELERSNKLQEKRHQRYQVSRGIYCLLMFAKVKKKEEGAE